MLYDDGIVFICNLENIAQPGRMPVKQLVKVGKYWFGERTVGYSRQYMARGVNERIDMLIRIHHAREVKPSQFAMLGNGEQFRITNVQHGHDDDTELRYTDLTLERLDSNYDVAE